MTQTAHKRRTPYKRAFFVAILAAILAVSASGYTIYATVNSDYKFFQPYSETWASYPAELKVAQRSMTLNPDTNQYDNATLSIRNFGATEHTGTVTLVFYDNTGGIIASGQAETGTVSPQITVAINIPITWLNNYTATTWARTTCEVTQTT